MKYSLFLLLMLIGLSVFGQSSVYLGYGFNQKTTIFFYRDAYQVNTSELTSRDLGEVAYSTQIGKRLNMVYHAQGFERIFEGAAVKGGLGDGTTVKGRISAKYLYVGASAEKYWGQKFQFFISGGIQAGFRIHADLDYIIYNYGPPSANPDPKLTMNQAVKPFTSRIPMSFGMNYNFLKKFQLKGKYQIAPELMYLGDFLANLYPISQSIHLGIAYRLD